MTSTHTTQFSQSATLNEVGCLSHLESSIAAINLSSLLIAINTLLYYPETKKPSLALIKVVDLSRSQKDLHIVLCECGHAWRLKCLNPCKIKQKNRQVQVYIVHIMWFLLVWNNQNKSTYKNDFECSFWKLHTQILLDRLLARNICRTGISRQLLTCKNWEGDRGGCFHGFIYSWSISHILE